MTSIRIVTAIAAATLSFSSLSFAQDYDRRGPGAGPNRQEQRGPDRRDAREDRRDLRNDRHDQRDARRDARNDRDHRYYNARGPQFHRGGTIPNEYRSRQYVVNDWRGHHLNAPPRGHQWVQVGTDYVLIAIATGLIANLLLAQ